MIDQEFWDLDFLLPVRVSDEDLAVEGEYDRPGVCPFKMGGVSTWGFIT